MCRFIDDAPVRGGAARPGDGSSHRPISSFAILAEEALRANGTLADERVAH
jgi:hypothetical protein